MSRRQIVKAGVWAAPVVVLAAASPAAAVSVTGVTLQVTNIPNNGGQPTSKYNSSIAIAGTPNARAWSVSVISSGPAGLTFAPALPPSVTTAQNLTPVVEATGSSGQATTFNIRLTSGTTVIDSNSATVSKK
ncbi:hypothetical protein BH10ACT5_BH10ACT5_21580 [soil metagenome]